MSKSKKPPVMQSVLGYEIAYPEMLQYEKLQMENYWTPSEPKVENDEHSLRSGVLTAAELHGVITASKLFVLYEVHVGTDYWSGRFSRMFPRPEFRRVAAVNSMVEMNIHAPFYKLINEILNIDTPEFYVSYTQSPVLKARMDHIESIVRDKNALVSLGAFSMIEGAILYSSFAFFLHFQQNGKNKLKAFNSGIEFSVRDENCLDATHQALTPRGWKPIRDITASDQVMQYDPTTKKLEFVHPLRKVTSKTKTAYHFTGANFDQVVTGKHRMITETGIVDADCWDGQPLTVTGQKDGDDTLSDGDKRIIESIVCGQHTTDWVYAQIDGKSSNWCREAVQHYLSIKVSGRLTDVEITRAFETLANVAGGYIDGSDFVLFEHSHDVSVQAITYDDEQEFYCLTVPSGAFVVKHNDVISVTGNCHSMAGAHAFRIALRESIEHGLMTKRDVESLHEALHECAITLFEHESHIIDMLFEKGEISGITKEQLKTFVESRLNLCLSQLGVPTLFIVDENTNAIAKWFYPLINMASIHDFFAKLGSQYSRGYSPSAFTLTENLKFIG